MMRYAPALLLIFGFAFGCVPPTFPTPEQNQAAIQAGLDDKSERIAPRALEGMWIGDKGSVLSFGPAHSLTRRVELNGKTANGTYKIEGYKLVLNGRGLGWIAMMKRDEFLFAMSREDVERFRQFAS